MLKFAWLNGIRTNYLYTICRVPEGFECKQRVHKAVEEKRPRPTVSASRPLGERCALKIANYGADIMECSTYEHWSRVKLKIICSTCGNWKRV